MTAGGDEVGSNAAPGKPGHEFLTLCVVGQPVQAKLDGAAEAHRLADEFPHFRGCRGRCNRANPVCSKGQLNLDSRTLCGHKRVLGFYHAVSKV